MGTFYNSLYEPNIILIYKSGNYITHTRPAQKGRGSMSKGGPLECGVPKFGAVWLTGSWCSGWVSGLSL